MNQQEVDRLFHENSHEDEAYTNGVMLPHGFAQAAAEIRRQALDEVMRLQRYDLEPGQFCVRCQAEMVPNDTGEWVEYDAIRALAQKEGKHD